MTTEVNSGSRLFLQHDTKLSADDPEYDSRASFYFEQAKVGEDNAVIRISQGCSEYSLLFLTAKNLDDLATFLSYAATKLRYCVKDKK